MLRNVCYPLTIYYDAACPLCRAEMHTIKQADFDEQLVLVDCSQRGFSEPASCPATRDAMMERIHAVDANGIWISGPDVFAAAYAAAGYKRLSRFWGSAWLRPLLQHAYPWLASNRHWLAKTGLPHLLNALLRWSAPKRR